MQTLDDIMAWLAFNVAQLYRFIPGRSHYFFSRTLQPWCRWRPKSRQAPFRGGLGYWLNPGTDNLFYISGLHEAQYLKVIHGFLRNGSTLIDIGANAGTSLLWLHFAKPVKKLAFMAVEAMPANVEILRANLALNPEVRCSVEAVALSNVEGKLDFASAGPGDGSARNVDGMSDAQWIGRSKISVNSTRLDALVEARSCKPDFLLIDVEGFAASVLLGGIATIEGYKPAVGLEIHSELERLDCEEVLFPRGYRVTWESFRYGHHRIYICQ